MFHTQILIHLIGLVIILCFNGWHPIKLDGFKTLNKFSTQQTKSVGLILCAIEGLHVRYLSETQNAVFCTAATLQGKGKDPARSIRIHVSRGSVMQIAYKHHCGPHKPAFSNQVRTVTRSFYLLRFGECTKSLYVRKAHERQIFARETCSIQVARRGYSP